MPVIEIDDMIYIDRGDSFTLPIYGWADTGKTIPYQFSLFGDTFTCWLGALPDDTGNVPVTLDDSRRDQGLLVAKLNVQQTTLIRENDYGLVVRATVSADPSVGITVFTAPVTVRAGLS